MAVEIKLAQTRRDLEEATVLDVKVAEAISVSKGIPADVEADKVSTDGQRRALGARHPGAHQKRATASHRTSRRFQIEAGGDGGAKTRPGQQDILAAVKTQPTPPPAEKSPAAPAKEKARRYWRGPLPRR